MKARPILFSGEMVRALLDGRKTQTRRAVKPAISEAIQFMGGGVNDEPATSETTRIYYGKHIDDNGKERGPEWLVSSADYPEEGVIPFGQCPYGQPGDLLWVRETWQAFFEDEMPPDRPKGPRHTMGQPSRPDRFSFVYYRADGEAKHGKYGPARWMPSIHMHRGSSRLTLRISSVRIEQLQDISDDNCIAEGVDNKIAALFVTRSPMRMGHCEKVAYAGLWDSIHVAGAWDKNPWVWVIEFEVIKKNVLEVQL